MYAKYTLRFVGWTYINRNSQRGVPPLNVHPPRSHIRIDLDDSRYGRSPMLPEQRVAQQQNNGKLTTQT